MISKRQSNEIDYPFFERALAKYKSSAEFKHAQFKKGAQKKMKQWFIENTGMEIIFVYMKPAPYRIIDDQKYIMCKMGL